MIIVLNIPIFLFGLRTMGKKYVLKSLVGMIVSSVMIDVFYEVLKVRSATDNKVLASIYGGILLGIGLGIVFRGRASTGGSDIVGMVVSKYTGMSIGFGIMVTDFVIISASGFAFRRSRGAALRLHRPLPLDQGHRHDPRGLELLQARHHHVQPDRRDRGLHPEHASSAAGRPSGRGPSTSTARARSS